MRRLILLLSIACVLSCSNHQEHDEKPMPPVVKTDTLPYFNVRGTILNEIEAIEQTPKILIYKLTEQRNKKDSVVIDTTQLIRLAAPFYETDLINPQVRKQYKETVFADNETKSYVLDYKTSSSYLPTKSLSVMLDNQHQDFKRLDMMRTYQQNDTLYEERLAWISGEKFQIIQLASSGNSELTKKTYVIWKQRK